MLEFILLVTMTWWFIIPASLISVWFIHTESDWWAMFSVLILGIVVYHFLQIPIKFVGYAAMAYIPLGILWSIYRWKRYCKTTFTELFEEDLENYSKTILRNKLDPKRQITKIVSWVLLFPFSFIESIIGDIIDTVETIIRKYLITIYNNISNTYTDQIK